MKRLALLLSLLLLVCLVGCASQPAPPTRTETAALQTAPAAEPAAPGKTVALEDFTVKTFDGGEFTLSQALRDHELVVINLFATWCGPCRMEFPFLQSAWEKEQDRVAVIALSVEPTDDAAKLRDFAGELGLSFPMGNAEGTTLASYVTQGIPTTLYVDRTGTLAGLEIGAMADEEAFLTQFADYTGPDYQPGRLTYTFYCLDASYNLVPGCVVNFCTDTTCTPVAADEAGVVTFTGPADRYHYQVITLPEGWLAMDPAEGELEPYSQTVYFGLTKEAP